MSVMFQLAVAGAHLTGLPLNHQLTELGARLVRTVRTAPVYSKSHSLKHTRPPSQKQHSRVPA
jgi:allophanate hydrolase